MTTINLEDPKSVPFSVITFKDKGKDGRLDQFGKMVVAEKMAHHYAAESAAKKHSDLSVAFVLADEYIYHFFVNGKKVMVGDLVRVVSKLK
jgi:hypothetical protein